MLLKLARLVNPGMIGSFEIYYSFKIKARFLGSVTIAIRLLGNNLFELVFFLEYTVHFLSTWLSLPMFANFKLVSVPDWKTLSESIQIPEVILPMAYARLTELIGLSRKLR